MAEVVLTGLSKTFGDTLAVDGVDLTIASGEFFSLLGPSGCGKTTTLRLIAGLEEPSAGSIRIGGSDVTRQPAHRRDIGMVFQNYALFPHLDVGGNVAYGLKGRKLPREARAARRAEALAQVALAGYESRRVTELSGGQQQRVAVARAIALHPALLLLDEPLSNLDARLRVETRGMLRRVQREVGSTAVYVTHDQEEALTLSDRLAVMHRGRLQQVGTPTEIYNQPANAFVATFIGRANLTEVTVLAVAGEDARVRLGSGAELTVRRGAASPGADQLAIACFRPEALRIEPDGPIEAVVRHHVFNGAWREYEVEVAGERWQVVEPNHRQPAHEIGKSLRLSAAAGAATLVPGGEE